MMHPKVSIMVPTYNQQHYIARAVESALQQDYANIEVVIADDSSSDETQTVVEALLRRLQDPRVQYFRNETNLGILRNYQRTLYEYASGERAINLDGDDFFVDRSFISKAVHLAQNDPAIVLAFGNYCEHLEATGEAIDIINNKLPVLMEGNDFVTRYARGDILWNHNCILYRRHEAIRIGFYWDEHRQRNDWESFLRLVINKKVGHVDTVAAAWVQHGANETKRIDSDKYLNNYVLINGIGAHARNSGVDPEIADHWVIEMKLKETRGSFIAYLKNRDLRGGLKFLGSASREGRLLPLKVLFDPGVWGRAVLAVNPALYARAKSLARKAAQH